MAQLEGSGRGALGSYNAEYYQVLADQLEAMPMKNGDEWLASLMLKNQLLGRPSTARNIVRSYAVMQVDQRTVSCIAMAIQTHSNCHVHMQARLPWHLTLASPFLWLTGVRISEVRMPPLVWCKRCAHLGGCSLRCMLIWIPYGEIVDCLGPLCAMACNGILNPVRWPDSPSRCNRGQCAGASGVRRD